MRALRGVKLVHNPGPCYEYSNTNFLILSLLVEIVSGEPFEAYIDQHIFQPLGMTNSFTREPDDLAQGHCWWFGFPFPFNAPHLPDALGAAFLVSSATDMARWLLVHLNDGSFDGVQLLSPSGIEELHRPQIKITKKSSWAAMGWRIEKLGGEERMVRHGGEVSNYRADMILLPSWDLGVIVLQNGNNGLVAQLGLDQIALTVVRLLLGMPVPHKKLSFKSFYLAVDVLLVVLSFLLLGLPSLAVSVGPGPLGMSLFVLSVFWPLLVLSWLPRVKSIDLSWQGLLLYVPDISRWLLALVGVSLLFSLTVVCVWLFAR